LYQRQATVDRFLARAQATGTAVQVAACRSRSPLNDWPRVRVVVF
jgi:hypothetical protein